MQQILRSRITKYYWNDSTRSRRNTKKANLKYELEKEEYNKDVEEGKVISQEPPYQANFKVKEGSQVKVVISKGQEKTKVPKVVGMKQDEAVKL